MHAQIFHDQGILNRPKTVDSFLDQMSSSVQNVPSKRRQATKPQKEKEEAGHNLIFVVGNGQTGTNWLGQIYRRKRKRRQATI
jgi:hypothetical protein